MKKTLLLMALLGGMTAQAEIVSVFADGYNKDNYRDAYNVTMWGSMCWAANASNVIAWWQDQLAEQGYAVPANAPKQGNVYPEYKAAFDNQGGYTENAIEWWIDGYYYNGRKSHDGHPGNYYDGLLNQDYGSFEKDSLVSQFFPATFNSLEEFSTNIINGFKDGRAYTVRIPEKSYNITVWGADYDTETGLLTHLYYSDPHDTEQVWHGLLTPTKDASGNDTYSLWAQGTVAVVNGLTCHLDKYLTEAAYTDLGTGTFSPIYNVEVDKGSSYTVSKELKAAGQDSALKGVVNGDITIKDGTATIVEGGSTQGAVVFTGETDKSRTLSVQTDGLTLSNVKVDATTGTNTLEVAEGKAVTISSMSGEGTLVKTGDGTLVNGGTLGNIKLQEGTLKGSGTFADVIVNGGTLIVGNSPGQQTYTEALTVNMGDIVFSVDGWKIAADSEHFGWNSGTYSNIMLGEGVALTLGEGANVKFAVGGEALATLLSGKGGFSMDIAAGIGNEEVFTSDLLQQLALQTKFYVTTENGAGITTNGGLSAGADLTARIYNLAYNLKDGGVLSVSGSFNQQVIPEPATGTLSLLALAGLCMRRRRK